ncbi:MAG: hypothetical protein JSS60_01830 [Verrucomicrobia bacterium]|nr:hypothetical protein [Verrucomicrobiota bacterium]
MAQPTTSPGIFHNLFAPLPPSRVERQKDALDHVADYADSSAGAWDLFRVGNHIFSAVEMYLSPSHHLGDVVGRVKEVFNTAGIGLSIPQVFSDVNSLRRSIGNLLTVQDLPYSDPLRSSKIAQAAKKSFLDTVGLTNTAAQIALFVDNAKIFAFDSLHLRVIDGVYNVTSAIWDGAELIGEYFKLQHYHSPEAQPRNAAEAAKLEEKKTLSWITIAKDVASVALAAISIGAIVFGIATSSMAVVSVALLGLSAFWLTMKLTGYFYNKVIVEAPIMPSGNPSLLRYS